VNASPWEIAFWVTVVVVIVALDIWSIYKGD